MADPETPPAAPAAPPAAPATPPADPGATPPAAPAALPKDVTEKLELAEKTKKEFEAYQAQVGPIMETLNSDAELLAKAVEVHNRRLGKTTTPPKTPDGTVPQIADTDTRNAVVNTISDNFEKKVGIDKLDAVKQKEMRGMVGQMVKEMLDPKGNKTITQVFEEVSLTKLPWYFEKAYDLITKDDQVKAAVEQGKNQVRSEYEEQVGGVGSMVGGSVPPDNITLSATERAVAAKLGVSEKDYLENKKAIEVRRNS